MFKIHVISDLLYGFHEKTEPEDAVIPSDVDLVIFNGNLATNAKRSILYAYTMAKKYPDVQFVSVIGI
jgi:predicted phosphodiesterase